MTTSSHFAQLRGKLAAHAESLRSIHAEVTDYHTILQERQGQLDRRVERLENQVDNITNPETAKSRKLLEDYERLSEAQSQVEETLDDLENLVLEPLWEAREVLQRLVS